MTKYSKMASELSKLRWRRIPKHERAQHVPRSGGRPRKYPQCPRYRAHLFNPKTGTCTCGFQKPEAK
jgi:hypothetical protein